MLKGVLLAVTVVFLFTSGAWGETGSLATMRGEAALDAEPAAPPMAKVADQDLRRMRNYPEQPPTIPHSIRDYHIDLNNNKCLTCHSRKATEYSQAPMISISHFMDRAGQFLATVSPRRYFCTQCHVPQLEARPLVENDFVDIDDVLARPRGKTAE